MLHDMHMFECFLKHPTLQVLPNPITILNIQTHQFEDHALNERTTPKPSYALEIPSQGNTRSAVDLLPGELMEDTASTIAVR